MDENSSKHVNIPKINKDKNKIDYNELTKIFSTITEKDLKNLGVTEKSHPKNFITNIEKPPILNKKDYNKKLKLNNA